MKKFHVTLILMFLCFSCFSQTVNYKSGKFDLQKDKIEIHDFQLMVQCINNVNSSLKPKDVDWRIELTKNSFFLASGTKILIEGALVKDSKEGKVYRDIEANTLFTYKIAFVQGMETHYIIYDKENWFSFLKTKK